MSAAPSGLHSMTGHGVGAAPIGGARLVVEIRAVNHRYLDVRVRLPAELHALTGAAEAAARAALKRGRVELIGRLEGEAPVAASLDLDRARAAFEQLSRLRDELRPGEDVPLSLLACVPDLYASRAELDHEAASAAVLAATERACAEVWAMRQREGEALAADLRGHVSTLEEQLAAVRERVPAVVREYRDRLHARIERLLADAEVALDTGRLEHEVALFADRADVAEELSRLASHAAQLEALLAAPEGSAGKRLDFLLQEMTREANTIGSKSADAELAHRVVEMKTAISRMREQAQNVL